MNGKRVRKCLGVAWAAALVVCFVNGRQHAYANNPQCSTCICSTVTFWGAEGIPSTWAGVWVTGSTTNLSNTAIPSAMAPACSSNQSFKPTGINVDRYQLTNLLDACSGAQYGQVEQMAWGPTTATVGGPTSIAQNACPASIP